jgi:hypothetical protein
VGPAGRQGEDAHVDLPEDIGEEERVKNAWWRAWYLQQNTAKDPGRNDLLAKALHSQSLPFRRPPSQNCLLDATDVAGIKATTEKAWEHHYHIYLQHLGIRSSRSHSNASRKDSPVLAPLTDAHSYDDSEPVGMPMSPFGSYDESADASKLSALKFPREGEVLSPCFELGYDNALDDDDDMDTSSRRMPATPGAAAHSHPALSSSNAAALRLEFTKYHNNSQTAKDAASAYLGSQISFLDIAGIGKSPPLVSKSSHTSSLIDLRDSSKWQSHPQPVASLQPPFVHVEPPGRISTIACALPHSLSQAR